jgi:dTDP-4-dehydrorhamnose 3,5-epimerase
MAPLPQVIRMEIPEVWVIQSRSFFDDRGSFMETYNAQAFAELGIKHKFVQDNQSISAKKRTIRGLHFQIPPMAQAKLVRVVEGSVLDVAIDVRRGSPTYGRHVSRVLSAKNQEQLFVPEGFAHGFCTLEDGAVVIYKVSNFYSPAHERGIRWDDALLAIDWGIAADNALLSSRDQKHPGFADLPPFFEWIPNQELLATTSGLQSAFESTARDDLPPVNAIKE